MLPLYLRRWAAAGRYRPYLPESGYADLARLWLDWYWHGDRKRQAIVEDIE